MMVLPLIVGGKANVLVAALDIFRLRLRRVLQIMVVRIGDLRGVDQNMPASTGRLFFYCFHSSFSG
ncbi:MAG: hypothetical protein LIP23_02080 [Planctomycetes bacterium]|nr:hypothetical protein [Planctomycetota bacterium]